jgi:hypothetical protein
MVLLTFFLAMAALFVAAYQHFPIITSIVLAFIVIGVFSSAANTKKK